MASNRLILILVLCALLLLPTGKRVQADGYGWIKGPADFRQHVIDALTFVHRADPADYAQTIRYITLVEPTDKGWSWIYGYDGACKVELNSSYATWQYDNTFQVGGDLVHEGALCRDYFMGNTVDVKADEFHALQVQRHFYIVSGAPAYLSDYMDQLIARHWPWG